MNEQLELSSFIKSVHKKLRKNSKQMGYEEAWRKHCSDGETLKKYASVMKDLACNHWSKNELKENSKVTSRMKWIHENCIRYFKKGGLQYQRQRELDIANRNELDSDMFKNLDNQTQGKYKLLDVGSCYNPLKSHEEFDVLPIDIAPATEEVLRCDFLNLKITEGPPENNSDSRIVELQKSSFDIVVFCLLLEYLPDSRQRLECCELAYELLKLEGLLVILTPDSKHVGKNAPFMKSWRYALAKIGFCRIKYEKLAYVHCMLFRKNVNPRVAKRWAEIARNKSVHDGIYIPQDFNCNDDDDEKVVSDERDNDGCDENKKLEN